MRACVLNYIKIRVFAEKQPENHLTECYYTINFWFGYHTTYYMNSTSEVRSMEETDLGLDMSCDSRSTGQIKFAGYELRSRLSRGLGGPHILLNINKIFKSMLLTQTCISKLWASALVPACRFMLSNLFKSPPCSFLFDDSPVSTIGFFQR